MILGGALLLACSIALVLAVAVNVFVMQPSCMAKWQDYPGSRWDFWGGCLVMQDGRLVPEKVVISLEQANG